MQVGIKVQVGKILKINKSTGWNKAMQVGILGNLLLSIMVFANKSQNLIKVQVGIRMCRLAFFQRLIRFAALLFRRLKYMFWAE